MFEAIRSNVQPPTSNLRAVGAPPRRILVVRLDRIGDVVLSTPALSVLRQAYPAAHLAMLVRPVCRELVEGHPDLNEVIVYDRDGIHHGWWATLQFAWALRSRRFDTALVLHPSNRSHVIPWAAGIPRRIGYDRKGGRLLTQRLPHRKQEGTRHESDYALDVVRALGVRVDAVPPLSVAQPREARVVVARWLAGRGVRPGAPLIALHPGSSDAARRWPAERFAQLGDRLAAYARARIVIVSGPEEQELGREVAAGMRASPIDTGGHLSLRQLTALLGQCWLLVSNDSGPAHLAAAVGTPVLSLSGRNQPGVGPRRWAPVGARHVALHKDKQEDGGRVCANVQCARDFLPLSALTVDDVFAVARRMVDADAGRHG